MHDARDLDILRVDAALRDTAEIVEEVGLAGKLEELEELAEGVARYAEIARREADAPPGPASSSRRGLAQRYWAACGVLCAPLRGRRWTHGRMGSGAVCVAEVHKRSLSTTGPAHLRGVGRTSISL